MKQVRGIFLPDGDTYFAKIIERDGNFEAGRLDCAFRYISSYCIAVDVGAHVGLRSQELAPRFSAVYAFEPHPETFACLQKNIGDYANVISLNYALGDEEKEVGIRESTTRSGNSGSFFCTEGSGIEMRTLDSFGLKHLGFLKIDVEGLEALVIQGGQETIQRDHPVIFLEQKNFKDREGRAEIDYRKAGQILESWGARCVDQVRNDKVYVWE